MSRDAALAGARRWGRRWLLRAQGLLDSEQADRFLPWIFATLVSVGFALLNAASLRSGTGGSGLAPWLQAVWRREHGEGGTPIGGVDPARASGSLIAEPILWLARWIPPEALFVAVQALALGAAVFPLWRICRQQTELRAGASTAAVLALALAPTLHRANLSPFHPELLALPLLLWAYLLAFRGHLRAFAVTVALALTCRADLGLTVAALGILLATGPRRRAGLITAASGLLWTAIALVAYRPDLVDESLTPSGEFIARASGPFALTPDLITAPLSSLRAMVAEPSVIFLVLVLAPFIFLPLVAPRVLTVAAPALVLAVITDRSVQLTATAGVIQAAPAGAHLGPALAFVSIALVVALGQIGRRSVTRVNVDRRLILALVAGSVLLFATQSPSSPYRRPWNWGSRDAVALARIDAADQIPPPAAVLVSPSAAHLVAARARVVELPLEPAALPLEEFRRAAATAEVVFLDTTGADEATGTPYWDPAEFAAHVAELEDLGFRSTYSSQGVHVFQRTA